MVLLSGKVLKTDYNLYLLYSSCYFVLWSKYCFLKEYNVINNQRDLLQLLLAADWCTWAMKKEEKTEYPPALRWEPGPDMRQSVDNRLAADAGSTEQTNKHAAQLCYTTLTTLSILPAAFKLLSFHHFTILL